MSAATLLWVGILVVFAATSAGYLFFTALGLASYLGRNLLVLAGFAGVGLLLFWLDGRGHLSALRERFSPAASLSEKTRRSAPSQSADGRAHKPQVRR